MSEIRVFNPLMRTNRLLVLCGLLVTLWSVKLFVLFFSTLLVYDPEDLNKATVAYQLVNNEKILPIFDYTYAPWEGGSLVVSLLSVLFFRVFGESFLSFKCLAITFCTVDVILIFLIVERYVSRKAAIVASLLFVFCPLPMTFRSLQLHGNHFEVVSFILASLYFFLRMLEEKRFAHVFLFGLTSGFATYFSYLAAISTFSMLIVWLVTDRRMMFRQQFVWFLVFFGIGFSPWIFYNYAHGFRGTYIGRKSLLTDAVLSSWGAYLKEFLFHSLRGAFTFQKLKGFNITYYFSFVYFFSFLASYLVLLMRWTRFRHRFPIAVSEGFALFCLVYPLVFVLAYAAYGIPPYPKRLIPLLVVLFMINSVVLARLSLAKAAFCAWLALLLAGGAGGIFAAASGKYPVSRLSVVDTVTYQLVGFRACSREDNMAVWVELGDRIREPFRLFFYTGAGWAFAERLREDPQKLGEMERLVRDEYKAFFFEGLGFGTSWMAEGAMPKISALGRHIESSFLDSFYDGVGASFAVSILQYDLKRVEGEAARLAAANRHSFYRGFGKGIGQYGGIDLKYCTELIHKIDPDYRKDLYEGLGFRMSWRFNVDNGIALSSRIEPAYAEHFLNGYCEGLRLQEVECSLIGEARHFG